jgi:hypothetical protein
MRRAVAGQRAREIAEIAFPGATRETRGVLHRFNGGSQRAVVRQIMARFSLRTY